MPRCKCEAETVQPGLSPGIVEEHETLVRFVLSVDFNEATKTVKPSLFSHAGRAGMSITRRELAGPERLAYQQASKGYVGFVTATCKAVRELRFERERVFCVYDTTQLDNPAHADICQTIFGPKSQVSEMRRSLQQVFGKVPISTIDVACMPK